MEKKIVKADHDNPVISIRGLEKAFEDYHVLRGIDLDLYQGENLVVLGRSGTGKSVLIKIISGLLKPDQGEITVLGHNYAHISEKELQELRIRIGFSFQNSALYDSMTVRKNLEFPLVRNRKGITRKEIDTSVETVLDAVGLSQTINQMPAELSGGQRKRIGIARTLILNPEIMLYDEPTTGLDPITSREISELILHMQQKYKTSSIIITHDLECARITADRIVVMNDGEYIAEGSWKDLQKSDNELVRSFFNETT